jgi:hypothetical protein
MGQTTLALRGAGPLAARPHWPRGRRRFVGLTERGVGKDLAAQTAANSRGPWRLSRSPALSYALPNASRDWMGLERVLPTG